jgi:hypothetical protein
MSEVVKCADCKYWDRDGVTDWRGRSIDLGGYGLCKSPKILRRFTLPKGRELSALPLDGTVVEYNERGTIHYYWGDRRILTGPDFGCVHGERR